MDWDCDRTASAAGRVTIPGHFSGPGQDIQPPNCTSRFEPGNSKLPSVSTRHAVRARKRADGSGDLLYKGIEAIQIGAATIDADRQQFDTPADHDRS
jgi:hypothetical protein